MYFTKITLQILSSKIMMGNQLKNPYVADASILS